MALTLVAPDSFKGSLPARRVAEIVAGHLASVDPAFTVVEIPMADGGDGTIDMAVGVGMTPVEMIVAGPLGEPVRATWAHREGTAIVELACAAGLTRLPSPPRSTFGRDGHHLRGR